jgi:MFS family permease
MHLRGHGDPAVMAAPAPLSLREQLTLSALWFGLNLQSSALIPIVVPLQIVLFVNPGKVGTAQQALALSWLSAGGAVVAVLVPPLAGALSDHTPGPWGRRRPYILLGGALLVLGSAEVIIAHDLGGFAIGFIILQIGGGVGTAAYQSLVPDKVPLDQRGSASGYIGLMTILGSVGSLGIAGVLLSSVMPGISSQSIIVQGANIYYGVTALVIVATVAVTMVGVHEVPLAPAQHDRVAEPAPGWRAGFAHTWLGPWRHRDFRWVFLTRVFVIIGLTLFMTYIELYFAVVGGATQFVQGTVVIIVLALFSAVFSALVLGVLSDRIGRVVVVCVATVLMGLAALAFVVAPGALPLWPLGLVFGLGYGAYSSVDWALAIDALPSLSTAGKDMGIWSIASNLPSVLAPLMGGPVIAIAAAYGARALGYRLVFALADLFFVLGAICVLFVRDSIRQRRVTA